MKNRRGVAVVALFALILACWCAATLRAEVSHPILTVQALYRGLIAGDCERALRQFAWSSEGAAARLRDLASSTRIFGQSPGQTVSSLVGCQRNLKHIATMLEMYSTDHSGRYPKRLESLTPDYLKTIPPCPAAKADTYSAAYRSASNPDAYTLICRGRSHAAQRIRPDNPEYNSTEGLVTRTYGDGEAVSIVEMAPPALWKMEDFTILGHRISGDEASVAIEETYSVYGYPTRIRVDIPLRRVDGRWLIDARALAADPMPPLAEGSEGVTLLWLKSRGFAAATAACALGGAESAAPSEPPAPPETAPSEKPPATSEAAPPDDPEALVKSLMEALETKNYAKMLSLAGVVLPEEIQQKLLPAMAQMEGQLVQWRIKSCRILDVRRDGGLAQVTVEETHFRDCPPMIRELLRKGAPVLDDGLVWGDNTVRETFVLVRLNDRWQFDFCHSGVDIASFPLKEMAEKIAQSEAPDSETQSRIARWANRIGVGQMYSVLCTSGPATAIAAAVLVPNFMRARQMGMATACRSNLKNLGTANEMYSMDHSGRYAPSLGDLTPNYLKAIPTCPAANADTYSPSYRVGINPDAYTIRCTGAHHKGAGFERDYPAFDSIRGLLEGP